MISRDGLLFDIYHECEKVFIPFHLLWIYLFISCVSADKTSLLATLFWLANIHVTISNYESVLQEKN